ncbi:MAG: hypothetical protein APZ16_00140 [Candidatus Hadarchaeum yellowstonense]|jgi:spermidine/putrescine transport system permease protein|uniref:ABC transmembrane type-1 domain-containing protein n=1 Tax=Hadarchaeum yellowstonense TaxID=1776334 RepID=A0A147JXP2_HADYE|nr:MAG: hypothetical protein APZ16_00140 [Candidatus Hadarchaeum yellowstonense]
MNPREKEASQSPKTKKIELRGILLVVPTYLWLIVTFLIPVISVLMLSFAELHPVTKNIVSFPTMNNYLTLFTNLDYVVVLLRTLLLTVAVTISSVGLAYAVAYFITFKILKNKYTILLAFQAPYIASYMMVLLAWRLLLGRSGVINSLLMSMGLTSGPIELLGYNAFSVWLVLTATWFPWLILPIFVSLEKIDRSLLEASQDLGASPFTTFLKVTFPLSLPGVFVAILFVFIPTIGEFVAPAVVGGTTGLMFGNLIYDFFLKGFRWDIGSAFAVCLLCIVILAVLVLFRKIGFEKLMESL